MLPSFLVLLCSLNFQLVFADDDVGSHAQETYKIEGKVSVSGAKSQEWVPHTRILVDGGLFIGFLKSDGTFCVNDVPTGSYVIEVANPTYSFEPARVDITSKGKMRARKLNHVQSTSVVTMSYPLRLKAKGQTSYFQKREQWKATDFLMNPMVLMMVLPLVLLFILPKMMNTSDPEVQKEMQSSMNMLTPKQDLPDMSELLTGWLFPGGKKKEKSKSGKRKP
ncbi:endoplasmic reticulum membrane protein complex subunit 7-like [Saccoglossus kowalevskii]|uniref:ER membrane protein complex subunit 7-like n=1 Tax=Saccoglossus kowalevskii TaxID=10224 RepID=A0ABM0GZU4_SACKO|nr:PREDICTED: ER membrane protein complex subunit 7-like [Saccoglossus kowalevskii]